MGSAIKRSDWKPFGHVLLVEDDPWVRSLLAEALEEAGLNVEVVPGCKAADSFLGSDLGRTVDLLVTDLELGDGDGGDLLGRANARGMPSICITGHSDRMPMVEIQASTAWLAKPFRLERLMTAVERALASRGSGSGGPIR